MKALQLTEAWRRLSCRLLVFGVDAASFLLLFVCLLVCFCLFWLFGCSVVVCFVCFCLLIWCFGVCFGVCVVVGCVFCCFCCFGGGGLQLLLFVLLFVCLFFGGLLLFWLSVRGQIHSLISYAQRSAVLRMVSSFVFYTASEWLM